MTGQTTDAGKLLVPRPLVALSLRGHADNIRDDAFRLLD